MAEQNLWGTLLTSMGTAAINSYFNNKNIEKQNKFNEEQAQLQRDYETEMSNTAYQRAYDDMKKAGLNPNLAGGQGGASTPTGTAATSAGVASFDLAGAMNANANAAATQAQIKNLNADTELKNKNAGKSESETKLIQTQEGIMKAQSILEQELLKTQNKKEQQEYKNAIEELEKIKSETDLNKAEKELKQWTINHPIASRLLPGVAGIMGGIVGMAAGGPIGGAIGMAIGNIGKRKIGF